MKFDDHRTTAGPRSTDAGFSIAAALSWGAMFPIAAGVLGRVDAFNLTTIRYFGASLIFLALLWAVEGRRALRYEGHFRSFWVLGTLGFAVFNLFAYWALDYTEPQNAALVVATMPLMTVLVRWVRDGVKPSPVVLGLIVVALGGVATVLGKGDPTAIVSGGLNIGDLLVLVGVFGFVLYSLGASKFPEFSPLRYTALTASAGWLTTLSVTAVLDLSGVESVPSLGDVRAEWLGIGFVILFGGVVGVLSWNEGTRRLGPSTGALFMNLVPITAFAIQIARGYDPAVGELIGAAVTIVAIVAANRVTARAAAQAAALAALSAAAVAPERDVAGPGRSGEVGTRSPWPVAGLVEAEAVEPARLSVVRMSDGGGARYADEEHAMRSRPRTYVQPVGTTFDRNLLR